ncbi:MAG TPA: cysteine desulfurase [Saprospiraceae bacterium]|nr:cysteine desulfurase [Saprospiraceae bacterium]
MDFSRLRNDFPVFKHHPSLVYLDSAATSQKPDVVIAAIQHFYASENANIHRGLYPMAARASRKYEAVREKVAHFIGATSQQEIVYTSGTTQGVNVVAQAFLRPRLRPGDEVIITTLEHHANIIPWQQLVEGSRAKLKVIPLNEAGELELSTLFGALSERTAMVACSHISNTLGTINPVREIVEGVRRYRADIPVLVDAAQSVAHYDLNVQALDCDFLVFSGHKLFGPTGIGVLYGKAQHLRQMSPITFGGDMIEYVSFERTSFATAPRKFEAGTTNIAGVIGLGAAIDYISKIDRAAVREGLKALHDETIAGLKDIPGLRIIGNARNKSAIVSFVLEQAHPHDIASFLGAENIAVRAGHHCTQPLMDTLGLPGTVRASFSLYNTRRDVERLVKAVREVADFFA